MNLFRNAYKSMGEGPWEPHWWCLSLPQQPLTDYRASGNGALKALPLKTECWWAQSYAGLVQVITHTESSGMRGPGQHTTTLLPFFQLSNSPPPLPYFLDFGLGWNRCSWVTCSWNKVSQPKLTMTLIYRQHVEGNWPGISTAPPLKGFTQKNRILPVNPGSHGKSYLTTVAFTP